MQTIIAKMRADWIVVEADRRACGDWQDADVTEFAASIRKAVESKDADQITLWARWLADLASIALGLKLSGITQRMRAQVAKQREEVKA